METDERVFGMDAVAKRINDAGGLFALMEYEWKIYDINVHTTFIYTISAKNPINTIQQVIKFGCQVSISEKRGENHFLFLHTISLSSVKEIVGFCFVLFQFYFHDAHAYNFMCNYFKICLTL